MFKIQNKKRIKGCKGNLYPSFSVSDAICAIARARWGHLTVAMCMHDRVKFHEIGVFAKFEKRVIFFQDGIEI